MTSIKIPIPKIPLPEPTTTPPAPVEERDIKLNSLVDVEDDDDTGRLTTHESQAILNEWLKPKRRNDPTVIAFIDAFIRCHNIKQASEEVGIHRSLGYRIRHYKDVAMTITKLIDKSSVKYGFDASEIMERTKELVDFDPIEVQNADGTFKNNFHDMTPEARRSIKKMKVKNIISKEKDINGIDQKLIVGEIIEFEFYDKLKAIDLSGKEKDMFKNTTKVEHSVSKDMASILLESARRGDDAKKLIHVDAIEVER